MNQQLIDIFYQAFPTLDNKGKQQALRLYALLAQGEPVNISTFAETIALSAEDTQILLDQWTGVIVNDDRVEAFWGLSTTKTPHSFTVGNTTLYTWCAWDLLFMPHLLGQTISAQTSCPRSKTNIKLTISEQGVEKIDPEETVLAFSKPDPDAIKQDVVSSFCQYVFFLASQQHGESWQAQHDNVILLSIEEGYYLGRAITEKVFK